MKRAKKAQIDSIVFDDRARLEFLTGFRKRRLLKKEAAKNKAKERERQERLEARKESRRALRERAMENAKIIEDTYKRDVAEGDESTDGEDSDVVASNKGKERGEDEFEDEEQLATVTIVEDFDPDSLRRDTSEEKFMKVIVAQADTFSNAQLSNEDFSRRVNCSRGRTDRNINPRRKKTYYRNETRAARKKGSSCEGITVKGRSEKATRAGSKGR